MFCGVVACAKHQGVMNYHLDAWGRRWGESVENSRRHFSQEVEEKKGCFLGV